MEIHDINGLKRIFFEQTENHEPQKNDYSPDLQKSVHMLMFNKILSSSKFALSERQKALFEENF
jgi:hypothetical protein